MAAGTILDTIPWLKGDFTLGSVGDLNYLQYLKRRTERDLYSKFYWRHLSEVANLDHPSHQAIYLGTHLWAGDGLLMTFIGWLYQSYLNTPSQPVAIYLKHSVNVKNAFSRYLASNELDDVLNLHVLACEDPTNHLLLIEPKTPYLNTFASRYGEVRDFLALQSQLIENLELNDLKGIFDFSWFDASFETFLKQAWTTPFPELLAQFIKQFPYNHEAACRWLAGMISGYPIDSCLQLRKAVSSELE